MGEFMLKPRTVWPGEALKGLGGCFDSWWFWAKSAWGGGG
jgi:hypothetical protein